MESACAGTKTISNRPFRKSPYGLTKFNKSGHAKYLPIPFSYILPRHIRFVWFRRGLYFSWTVLRHTHSPHLPPKCNKKLSMASKFCYFLQFLFCHNLFSYFSALRMRVKFIEMNYGHIAQMIMVVKGRITMKSTKSFLLTDRII